MVKFILIVLCLFCQQLKGQVVVHLPQDVKGQLLLYAYYPDNTNNQPLQIVVIENGQATLKTNKLKEGIYSLYYTQNYTLDKASYVDICISATENNFQLYWMPNKGVIHFSKAPQNNARLSLLRDWTRVTEEQMLMETIAIQKDSVFQNELKQDLALNANNRESLIKKTVDNNFLLDNYLVELHNWQTQEKTFYNFWQKVNSKEAFLWSTPYKSNILNNWQELCRQHIKDSSEQQEIYISGIIQNLGKNKELHPFLNDWLYQNYNYNNNNDGFLLGLSKLISLPNADNLMKEAWKNTKTSFEAIALGKNIDVSMLETNKLITETDNKIILVMYSESCDGCADVLNQLNKIVGKKTIAVRIKASENSLVKIEDYPNIKFHLPDDVSYFKSLAPRSTPTILYLIRKEKKWIIEEVN